MPSLLHAADLHLGMRITRFDQTIAGKIREARFKALDNILEKARELQVDLLLIAGDLFDDATVDNLTARRAFEMLESLTMPVYVLPGNHDPLLAGGVWDRPPWNQQPSRKPFLLDMAKPVKAIPGLTLFPCPVLRKTSMEDPTAWIAQAPEANGSIRVGVAHGSLKTRDDLPPDDHLIPRHAAADLKLDYLALGHWHGRRLFEDPAGVERTAYSGTHEPMRFQGSSENLTGWSPYSGGSREEFLDGGKGEVLHVRFRAPGEPPQFDPLEVGHFQWLDERRELASAVDLESLIKDVATRPAPECRLLRLRLSGVLDAGNMLRLEELREILKRYLLGELDGTRLHLQPTEEEMREAAGQGVLHRVLEKLRAEAASPEPDCRNIAERAILLLYQIAQEVKA